MVIVRFFRLEDVSTTEMVSRYLFNCILTYLFRVLYISRGGRGG